MSSGSNQGYLSSDVDLFVSSAGNSVHVVVHGIYAGSIDFSYANGDGLNVAGVTIVPVLFLSCPICYISVRTPFSVQ